MPDVKTYTRFKEQELCLSCGDVRAEGDNRFCAECRQRHRIYSLRYYDKTHPHVRRKRQPRQAV